MLNKETKARLEATDYHPGIGMIQDISEKGDGIFTSVVERVMKASKKDFRTTVISTLVSSDFLDDEEEVFRVAYQIFDDYKVAKKAEFMFAFQLQVVIKVIDGFEVKKTLRYLARFTNAIALNKEKTAKIVFELMEKLGTDIQDMDDAGMEKFVTSIIGNKNDDPRVYDVLGTHVLIADLDEMDKAADKATSPLVEVHAVVANELTSTEVSSALFTDIGKRLVNL